MYYRNLFCKANLSLQQPFLDNRLTVSLNVDNVLRSNQKVAYYTRVADMELDWNRRLDHRMFRLSVKFTL